MRSLTDDQQTALRAIWNDIALSEQLGGGWVARTAFDVDASLSFPEAWVDLSVEDFLVAFAASDTSNSLASTALTSQSSLNTTFPGLITRSDLARFQGFMLLRQIAPAENPQLNNDNDLIVDEDDVNEFLELLGQQGDLTEIEAAQFLNLAIGLGLVDQNFGLDDVRFLLELSSIALTGGGVILATRGVRLARGLFLAAGATGAGVVGICLLYTSPSPRDRTRSRMPSSA